VISIFYQEVRALQVVCICIRGLELQVYSKVLVKSISKELEGSATSLRLTREIGKLLSLDW